MERRKRSEFPDEKSFHEHLRQLNSRENPKRPGLFCRESRHRQGLGFYKNFNDVDDNTDPSAWSARRMACHLSPYVVALSYTPDEGRTQLFSSGVILEHRVKVDSEDGDEHEEVFKKIISSTYIIGGSPERGLQGGIGGPLVLRSSGAIVGMNVFCNRKSSSFIPSVLLAHHLEHLLTNGEILRPWLGLKARDLNEKSLMDLEALYRKFHSTNGIFVTDVAKGSPAERAGICVNDIITECCCISTHSTVEFADLLLKLGKASCGGERRKRKLTVIEVVVQSPATSTTSHLELNIEEFTSPVKNRWPVLVPLGGISGVEEVDNALIFQGEYDGPLGSGSLTRPPGYSSAV